MKLKVKSHVQQERNMRGHKDKFPTAPPPLGKREGPYTPKVPTEDEAVNPFAKQLASGDKEIRDATFAALAKWLGVKSEVPLLDMKKIWKGLFYAMWHADGWDVQEELAEQIGGVVHGLKHKVMLTYLGVFYLTARREWVGIDRHRMDKYLLLVRRVTSHALRYCADRSWKLDVVQDIALVFEKAALVGNTKGVVDVGLRLHVAELFFGELRKVAAGKDWVEVGCDPDDANEPNGGAPRTVFRKKNSNGKENARKDEGGVHTKNKQKKHKPTLVPTEATELFLNAFATVLQNDPHAPLHDRVLRMVFEAAVEGADGGVCQQALLSESFTYDDDESDGIDPIDRKEALAAATMVRLDSATMKKMSRAFINLGAVDGVGDLNRESLYAIHTMFKKAAKKALKAAEEEGDEGNDAARATAKESGKEPVETHSGKKKCARDEETIPEDNDSAEDSDEASEEDPEDQSFYTAADNDEEEGDDDDDEEEEDDKDDEDASKQDAVPEASLTPSKRKNLVTKFEDVKDGGEDDDDDDDDDFEEADEFAELMEDEDEDDDGADPLNQDNSLDDSDLDASDSDSDDDSDSGSDDDSDNSDDEMKRHELAVAAGIAAAERKALRKAERWAVAVGSPAMAVGPSGSIKAGAVARRALGNNGLTPSSPGGGRSPGSPSKKVLWNLKRNTRHTPTGPPNPVRGDTLRALLNSTPRKSLLNPIHAAQRQPPKTDPGVRTKPPGRETHGQKKKHVTMTPGRKKVKASHFF